MDNKIYCKYCGEKIDADSLVCYKCGKRLQTEDNIIPEMEVKALVQPNWKTLLTWVSLVLCPPLGILFLWIFNKHFSCAKKIILTLIFLFLSGIYYSSNNRDFDNNGSKIAKNNAVKVVIADFSTMSENTASEWCTVNKINCNITSQYSDIATKGKLIRQSEPAGTSISEGSKINVSYSLGKEPSIEFKNALKTAEEYAKTMHMSKRAIFSQLTSEYGEGFPKDAAQFAVDNLKADYNANALKTAKNYSEEMHMSKKAIYDQLISDYGEKFTREEAQYAVDNLYK